MVTDNRIHYAAEAWRSAQQEEHPDKVTADFADGYLGFLAGWHARTQAASDKFQSDDFQIFTDQIEVYRKQFQHIFDALVEHHRNINQKDRIIQAQRTQLAVMGGDPLDAPAYKRIINQRQEIKRLNAVIDELKLLNEARLPLVHS